MRLFIAFLVAAAPAAAQPVYPNYPQAVQPAPARPAPIPAVWNPTEPYIAPGQDEPGYRRWYTSASWRRDYVKAFHNYLTQYGVAGVVPTWQLLRTATSWDRCGSEPFEVPPVAEWPHIVRTLQYVQHFVVPVVGPVEPVSGYRNPHLNVCSGGAPASSHKSYSAIDLVPLQPTTREQLMRRLCAVHGQRGSQYGVGLGFYAFLRFHVDTTKYRRWGVADSSPDCPQIIRPEDIATVAQPIAPGVPAGAAVSTISASHPAQPQPAQQQVAPQPQQP